MSSFPFCVNSSYQHSPTISKSQVVLQVACLSKSLSWHLQKKLPQLLHHFFIFLLWPFSSLSPGTHFPPLFLFFSPNGTGHLSVPNYAQTTAVVEAFSPCISHHLEQCLFFPVVSFCLTASPSTFKSHLKTSLLPCLCLLISLSLCYYVLFNFDKYLGMLFVWNKFY